MSVAHNLATGRGEVSWRIEIERLETQFVSYRSQINQVRKQGLSLDGAKTKVVSNPATCELEVSALGVRISGADATAAFAQAPTLNTWLTAELTAAATSMSVRSTAGWPSSGVLFVNSECIFYGSITDSTTFGTLTRGQLGTVAQKHYITVGALLRYPEVTNRAVTLAGARAKIYWYGQNDDPQGDGTLWWCGALTRDPSYSLTAWSLSIEPLTTLLKRTANADIANALRPSGISYTQANPFRLSFNFNGSSYTVQFPVASGDTGRFSSNFDFCAYVNTKLAATPIDAAGWKIRAVPDGDRSWHLEMVTPTSVTAGHYVYVNDAGEPSIDPRWRPDGYPQLDPGDAESGVSAGAFVGSTRYYWMPTRDSLPGAGSVPRGYHGFDPLDSDDRMAESTATFPSRRLYLDGAVDVAGLSAVKIEWEALGPWRKGEHLCAVESSDASTSSIVTGTPDFEDDSGYEHGFTAAALPQVRLGRDWIGGSAGSLGEFLESVIDAVPDGLNAGAVPNLRDDDFETLPDIFPTVFSRIVKQRRYSSFGAFDLMDVIKAECLLAGYGLGVTPQGRVRFFELIPPVPNGLASEGDTFTGERRIIERPLVDKAPPSWQPMSQGLANQVLLKRGYSAREDRYLLGDTTVRDVAAFGQSPRPRTVIIEPKSVCRAEDVAELVERAQALFAMFAYPHATIVVDCDLRYRGLSHGETVYLTSPHVPNVATGTVGVRLLPALVIGIEPTSGSSHRLYLYAQQGNLCAYVPEFFISAESGAAKNWDIIIDPTIDGHTFSLREFYEDGYRIRVWKYDDTSPAVAAGVITAVTDTTASLVLDTSSTLGTGTWVLSWADADDGIDAAQQTNAYVAASDGRIPLASGSIAAKVFG